MIVWLDQKINNVSRQMQIAYFKHGNFNAVGGE